jgi:hypothetical protein
MPKHIIKSTALMSAAELQQTEGSWKSIMKRRLLEAAHSGLALNVKLS